MTQLGALNERLQSKLQQDRMHIEAQTQAELQNLNDSLKTLSLNALSTIETAINKQNTALLNRYSTMMNTLERENQRLQKTLFRSWVRNLLIASGIILGLAMGTWGISTFLSKKAEGLQATISSLETHQARLVKTIMELEKKTGGIVFMVTQNGKFIVLPQGINLKSGWTIGKLPAWKME